MVLHGAMSTRSEQYNLRSGRTTSVQIPVQLQLQRDVVMATKPGTSADLTDQCQVSVYNSDEININVYESNVSSTKRKLC